MIDFPTIWQQHLLSRSAGAFGATSATSTVPCCPVRWRRWPRCCFRAESDWVRRDPLLRHVRRTGVVVRRQHLVHAGRRLHPLGAFSLGALRLCVPVRDWLSLGGSGRGGDGAGSGRRTRKVGGIALPFGMVFLFWWLQGVAIEPWLQGAGMTSTGTTRTGLPRCWPWLPPWC